MMSVLYNFLPVGYLKGVLYVLKTLHVKVTGKNPNLCLGVTKHKLLLYFIHTYTHTDMDTC